MNKKLIWGIVIVVVVVGGIYFYKAEKNTNYGDSEAQLQLLMKDWKTFNHPSFGYEIKYPEGYLVDTEKYIFDNVITIVGPINQLKSSPQKGGGIPTIRIATTTEKGALEYEKQYATKPYYKLLSKESITLNGSNAIKLRYEIIECEECYPGPHISIIVEKSSVYYIISYLENALVYEKIAATFKFTSPKTDDNPTSSPIPTPSITTPAISISVKSPNGGETFKIGQETRIAYEVKGGRPDYYIALILEPGYIPVATLAATTTSYTWKIPSTVCLGGDACMPITPGKFTVTAQLYDKDVCIGYCVQTGAKLLAEDISNAEFTITN